MASALRFVGVPLAACVVVFAALAAIGSVSGTAAAAVGIVLLILLVPLFLLCVFNRPLSWLLPRAFIAIATRIGGSRELYRGVFAVEAGHIEEGADIIERYAATHPHDPKAYLGRASVFMARHDLDPAAEAVRRSLEIEGTPQGLHMRALVRMIAGDHSGALDDCEESLSGQPHNVFVKGIRCACLVALSRLDTAVEESTSLRRTWGNAGVAVILAEAHRLLQEPSVAETWVEDALALARTCQHPHPEHHDIVAWCLVTQGDLEGAERAVESALEIDPEGAMALSVRPLIALKRGDMSAVEASLIKLMPASRVSHLTDPLFTPLLAQQRFRDLLATAMENSRREREEVLRRLGIDTEESR